MAVEEFAPAKINLTLHVTGRRDDGYHLLDSLVTFAAVGDRIAVSEGPGLTLAVEGPFAGRVPAGDDNLVLRAARLMMPGGAAVRLVKALPVASGIGGGSSDAAATLRALHRLTGLPLPAPEAIARLGADVPVCMTPGSWRMQGIGERLCPGPVLPDFWFVLANPGQAVPTAAVFAALARRENPPMSDMPSAIDSAAGLAGFLCAQRNDLQDPACAVAPVIGEVLAALAALPGCLLARMSGSGATCFGLFAAEADARSAAAALAARQAGWWVAAAPRCP